MRNHSKSRPSRRVKILGVLQAALCAAALSCHAAGNLDDLDRDNGLPDARLGTPLKAFQGLQKTEDTGRWLTFSRPADVLRYGRTEVTGITYNFFKEQLYSIRLDVEGTGNVRAVLKALEATYGKDHTFETRTFPKTNAQLEVREWAGKKAYCVYQSGSDSRGAALIFVDRPTWDLLQVPKREKEAQSRHLLNGSYTNGDF